MGDDMGKIAKIDSTNLAQTQTSPQSDSQSAQVLRANANSFAFIFALIILVYILALLLPSGMYERTGRIIDPNSFHFIDKVYLSPLRLLYDLPLAIYHYMGQLFIAMLVTAGAIGVAQESKAMDLAIHAIVQRYEGRAILMIPLLVAFTGFLGSASVMLSTSIAFIPLGLTIARRLDIDNIFPLGLIFLGSFTGFMASPISPITTALAQGIAGLPILSGFFFRLVLVSILLSLLAGYLTLYAYRVQRDKGKSVMKKVTLDSFGPLEDLRDTPFTLRHALVLCIFFASFLLFAYGSKELGFKVGQLTSIMLPAAFLMGLVAGMDIGGICASISRGMASLSTPLLFMMIASSVGVILSESSVMDTIVHYIAMPLSYLGHYGAALGMFVANALINLGIPSGSGQAVVVMPIMAPLADALGITRQVAVLAYQLGDGFTNLLNPASAMLLGSLALVRASFSDWMRFIAPLYVAFLVVCVLALLLAVFIGWS